MKYQVRGGLDVATAGAVSVAIGIGGGVGTSGGDAQSGRDDIRISSAIVAPGGQTGSIRIQPASHIVCTSAPRLFRPCSTMVSQVELLR